MLTSHRRSLDGLPKPSLESVLQHATLGCATMAAIGYAALGKPKAVALIVEALRMLSDERDALERKGLLKDSTIHDVFRHFSESDMAALDSRIPEDEWWIDEERVAYVRKNRIDFKGIR